MVDLFTIPSAQAACAVGAICPSGSAPSSVGSAPFTTIITNVGGNVVDIITLLAGILAVIYLVWSGIQYITAGGSADKAKAARAGIINAIIGIAIIVAAYFIIRVSIGIGNEIACSDNTSNSTACNSAGGLLGR